MLLTNLLQFQEELLKIIWKLFIKTKPNILNRSLTLLWGKDKKNKNFNLPDTLEMIKLKMIFKNLIYLIAVKLSNLLEITVWFNKKKKRQFNKNKNKKKYKNQFMNKKLSTKPL